MEYKSFEDSINEREDRETVARSVIENTIAVFDRLMLAESDLELDSLLIKVFNDEDPTIKMTFKYIED